ncbi:MAG: hypothetical protein KAX49_17695 [Halanaerobiales bacterium]|nr:hypothetical protein [Halanaerobiales bacterium]
MKIQLSDNDWESRSKLKKGSLIRLLLGISKTRNHSLEYLWIITFKGNDILRITKIKGGKKNIDISISEVINRVKADGAVAYTLIHNHPAGSSKPSTDDELFLGELLKNKSRGVRLRDFIIFSERFIWSFQYNRRLCQGEMNPIFWEEESYNQKIGI